MAKVKVKLTSFHSNKGGTGKTSATINVGAAMAQLNPESKVLIIDADPNSRTTSYLAGPSTMPRKDMFDFFREKNLQPESVLVRSQIADNLFVAPNVRGMEIRPKVDSDRMNLKLKVLFSYLEDNNFAHVIFDLPAGKAKEHLLYSWISDVYVVTRPLTQDLRAAQEMIATLNSETLRWLSKEEDMVKGIVLNSVVSRKESEEAKKFVNMPIVAEIPHSVKVEEAGDRDQPVVTYAPGDEASREYFNLAERLMGTPAWEDSEPKEKERVRGKGALDRVFGGAGGVIDSLKKRMPR